MSDEIKTDATKTETQTENSGNGEGITLTQDKLNSLINEKYKKGAEKAQSDLLESLGIDSVETLQSVVNAKKEQEEADKTELQKALETIDGLTAKVTESEKSMSQMKEDSTLSTLALKSGVKDVDYFKYEYNKEKAKEGFNLETFVNGLKEAKPYVFGENVAPTPSTDNSGNGAGSPNDLATKVQGLSFAELQALQNQL